MQCQFTPVEIIGFCVHFISTNAKVVFIKLGPAGVHWTNKSSVKLCSDISLIVFNHESTLRF